MEKKKATNPQFADVYIVILAGGSGTRFWPRSRQNLPKQLCKFGDSEKTMIELTIDRIKALVPPERRIIVTHAAQVEMTKEIVGKSCEMYIAEPQSCNTAAALTAAALEIEAIAPKTGRAPFMISLHADHLITPPEKFVSVLENALRVAKYGYLTLVGVPPQYPETGYGYIHGGPRVTSGNAEGFGVLAFKEKPDLATAQAYLLNRDFYWNTGIFIWRVDAILAALGDHVKETRDILRAALREAAPQTFTSVDSRQLAPFYKKLPHIAIDQGVLEKCVNKIALVKADFNWQDIGSWSALEQAFPTDENSNILQGDVLALETRNSIVQSDGPLVTTLGVENMIVVATKDSVLVCPKDQAQSVKKVVDALKKQGRGDLL